MHLYNVDGRNFSYWQESKFRLRIRIDVIQNLAFTVEHQHSMQWTSDEPDGDICAWQNTSLTRDRHPCPRREWSPQSQEASGRRPRP